METTYDPNIHTKHWVWLIVAGILLVIVGILAILYPLLATVTSLLYLGIALVVGGALQVIFSFVKWKKGEFFIHLFLGLLAILVGVLILTHPGAVLAAITLLLAGFFLTLGIFRVLGSLIYRYEDWGWILLSGVVDIILGLIILYNWPASALWLLGILIGVDFLFAGWSFVANGIFIGRMRKKSVYPA